ncbi:MAG: hypothetical protein HY662_00005, partial [Chloroflexi bacterium]|nr:hypothetical protein [Chloroflexota bacterium]
MKGQEMEKEQLIRELIICQERINEMEKLRNQEKRTLRQAVETFESLFEFSPDALIVV